MFWEPIHVGELITFQASVNRIGRTSMEIGVRVNTHDLVSQVVRHTNSCYFTMVAIGPDGRPVEVPPWQPAVTRTTGMRPRQVEDGGLRALTASPAGTGFGAARPVAGHPSSADDNLGWSSQRRACSIARRMPSSRVILGS